MHVPAVVPAATNQAEDGDGGGTAHLVAQGGTYRTEHLHTVTAHFLLFLSIWGSVFNVPSKTLKVRDNPDLSTNNVVHDDACHHKDWPGAEQSTY